MSRAIRAALADIKVPAELHDRLVERVLAAVGVASDLSEAALLDEVYFQVYTSPEIRKRVGYHHPLDTFR